MTGRHAHRRPVSRPAVYVVTCLRCLALTPQISWRDLCRVTVPLVGLGMLLGADLLVTVGGGW